MSPKLALVAGLLLGASGAVVAFLDERWTGAAAASIVVVGLALAIWSLATRDDRRARSHAEPRPRNIVATALVVAIGAVAGGLAAVTGTDAWFAVAVFLALVIWSLRPTLMD